MLVIPEKLPSEHVCGMCVCVCDRGVTVNVKLRPPDGGGGNTFDCRVKLQNIPSASEKTAKLSNFPQTGEETAPVKT